MPKNPFSESDQEQIKKAVAEAESKTSGEIVTYYVSTSDNYQEAVWRGGIITTLLSICIMSYLTYYYGDWAPFGLYEILGIVFFALFTGIGLSYVPFFKRILAGKHLMNRRVGSRSMQAFVEEEVFDTSDRTGILIFMSMFEKHVQVIGDTGINAKVKQSDWNDVINLVRDGMKLGKPANGLVDAIEKCGELLHLKGVAIKPDDVNELKDGIRIGS